MKVALAAAAVLAGLFVVALLAVGAAALFATLRDEFRRRRETDLPPRVAELRREFFREDIDRMAGVKLWFLWYEDRFDLEDSMSFGISAHFSAECAQRKFDERGRPLQPGWDGYTIEGPVDALTTGLFGRHRVAMLGLVLRRIKAGSTEWIPLPD